MMNKPKIAVTRCIGEQALERLYDQCDVALWDEEDPPPYEKLVEMASRCEGLLCLLTDRIDRSLLENSRALRVVSTMSVGYEHIDLKACQELGIQIGHTPGVLTDATADFALALMLSVARKIPESAAFARDGHWKTWGPRLLLGMDLNHTTLGIIGMGRIGQAVAKRAAAFEMSLVYHDLERLPQVERNYGARFLSLDELLRVADIVTLHVALNKQTQHLIAQPQLEIMKSESILINTARGSVVHTMDLLEALREGKIAGAGLDVTDPEPLPRDHPLYEVPNCLITPHIASAGEATRTKMAQMAVDNLLAVLEGVPMPHPVL
jgi:glyoxylate reductase